AMASWSEAPKRVRPVSRLFSDREVGQLAEVSLGRVRAARSNRYSGSDEPRDQSRKPKWTLEELHDLQRIQGTARGRSTETDQPVVLAVSAPRANVGNTTACVNLAVYLAIR